MSLTFYVLRLAHVWNECKTCLAQRKVRTVGTYSRHEPNVVRFLLVSITNYVLRFTFYVLQAMKGKQKGPRPKHIPQRTCVACRRVNAKRGLVRIVRTPEGSVVVDETGKRAGRGAYLCRVHECWDLALKKKALEYALKTAISLED